MQVTIETADGLERRMRVVVPSENIDSQVDSRIKETSRTVKVKGFRPGRVPPREVKRRFGKEIRQNVAASVIQSSFDEAVTGEQLSPAGAPRIVEVVNEAGRDFEFLAIFEVFPEVNVAPFKGVSVERLVSQVEDADIDNMIEILRKQRSDYVEVDRPCAEADQVNIDFEGFVDGEAFTGSTATGQDIVVGSGAMIRGFEEGLTGMQAGDEKTITVTFPESHQNAELAGKNVAFKVTLHRVSEPRLPELNEAFYEMFDVTDGSIETFRAEIKSNMERELEIVTQVKIKEQVIDALCEINEFELPAALVTQEVNRMREATIQRFAPGNVGIDPETIPAGVFKEQATRRLKVGLLLTAIAKKYELQADPARVDERIVMEAGAYENPDKATTYIKANEQEQSRIRNLVLEDQIVDLVLKSAKVKDVKVNYETAVKPAVAAGTDQSS